MASNMLPAAPARQEDQTVTGGWLTSGSANYLIQSFLGRGSSGRVAECTRVEDMKTVAIKMIKNKGSLIMQARAEVKSLLKVRSLDPDKCNIIRWYQFFIDRGYTCLEFEQLDKSLSDFMRDRHFRPLPLKEIRPVVQQVANALDHLKAARIIHADLKLENVMLVNHAQEPYRVKLIDFGLAHDVSAARVGSRIQTCSYRAPEILLGRPFTEAIDVWSLGCLAAGLHLGQLLYPGRTEYDMMRYIRQTQGQPPDYLLTSGSKTPMFFQRVTDPDSPRLWRLKTPEQYLTETGIQSLETRTMRLDSLDDLLPEQYVNPENSADKIAEMTDLLMFVEMVKGMLQLDAAERFTPRQVMEHPFTSMCHTASLRPLSAHVRSSLQIMAICQRVRSSDSGTAVGGSLQQSSSRTVHPVQQPPPPPAAGSGPRQPNSINPQPRISTKTTGPVKSGFKRKVDAADGKLDKSPSLSKRVQSKHSDGPSTSSSNQACTVNNDSCTHQSKGSQTQSCVRPGIKRKMADAEDVGCQRRQSDHHERSRDDRKRSRKSSASQRISTMSSQTHSRGYYQRSGHDRKRVRGSSVGRSYSSRHDSTHSVHNRRDRRSSWTDTRALPRGKRKMRRGDDSDYYQRSGHDRKRVRGSTVGRSYSGRHDSTHTVHDRHGHRRSPQHTSHQQQTERDSKSLKGKTGDDEGVQPRKRAYALDRKTSMVRSKDGS